MILPRKNDLFFFWKLSYRNYKTFYDNNTLNVKQIEKKTEISRRQGAYDTPS